MSEKSLTRILTEIKEAGSAKTYTKGISMLPLLKENRDISVLIPIEKPLLPGDVVLYVRKNEHQELVLHRIVKITADGFLIRGDNTFSDERVRREDIVAVLGGFFRKGRYVDCQKSLFYRLYSSVWTGVYPLRKFFRITLKRRLAKIKHLFK